jgi:hypothetical protein
MTSVDNIRLNFERATEHLKSLNEALDKYYALKPCLVTKRFDPESQRDIYLLQVTKIPDLRLGIFAGDYLHNLRACLDHLFWQLALIESGGKTPKNHRLIEFPISYKDNISDTNKAWLVAKLCYIPKDARSIIENIQPYTAGQSEVDRKSHPLYLLNALCNIAKHRVIPVRSMMAEMTIPHVSGSQFRICENATWEISLPIPHQELPSPRASIMFGDIEDEIDAEATVMGSIFDFVSKDVLPKFAQFFIEDAWFQSMKR